MTSNFHVYITLDSNIFSRIYTHMADRDLTILFVDTQLLPYAISQRFDA
jgi:hypothetical protein